jgi:ABC-type branched-subunit amino acid transport system ATPase component
MIGGTIDGTATFFESLWCLPRHRRDEKALRREAELALWIVGLEALAPVRADRLQHSELRFMEIARALMLHPRFLLLDEPAAGLSAHEIQRLGGLIKEISRRGTGVLLVEHHADLIFDICDHVTGPKSRPGARGPNAGGDSRPQGGGQCLSRELSRCSPCADCVPAMARSSCYTAST